MTIHRLTDGNHRALQKTFQSLCPPRKPGGCTQLVPISQLKSAPRQRPHWAKMSRPNDVYQHCCTSNKEERPTNHRKTPPSIVGRTKLSQKIFIRPYLGRKRLPTGSSLLIGKPKTSPFRSCHPQRLNQRTLKVTVQRLALKLPKRITFFADRKHLPKNYICKELKSCRTSLVLDTLTSARSSWS